jgi:hypothetical protein
MRKYSVGWWVTLARVQVKLGLPLPGGATASEVSEAELRLREARACLPDLAGLESFRRWVGEVHRRHGSVG